VGLQDGAQGLQDGAQDLWAGSGRATARRSLTPLGGGGRGSSLGHGRGLWLGALLLRGGRGGDGLVLGLHDAHVVGEGLLGADLTAGVPGQHDLHLDAQHTWSATHGRRR